MDDLANWNPDALNAEIARLQAQIAALERQLRSERTRAGALQEGVARYRVLFDRAFDAILVEDADERIIDANSAACDLLGYRREELLDMRTRDLQVIMSDDEDLLIRAIYAQVAERVGRGERFETTIRRQDGALIPVDIALTSLRGGQRTVFLSVIRDMTGPKQREAAINASEARYRAIITAIPDVLLSLSRNGVYLDVNAAHPEMLVLPREQMIGKTLFDLLPHDVASLLLENIQEVLETGLPREVEYELAVQGGQRIFDTRLVVAGPEEVLLIARDVSHQRFSEAAYERLRHQTSLILEAVGEGILGLDAQGHITFLNPAASTMLGFKDEECTGRPLHELIHYANVRGEPCHEDQCDLMKALRQGTLYYTDDDVFWRKEGTGFLVEYACSPLLENGQSVGGVVVFRDITERKRARDALTNYARRLNLVYTIEDGVLSGQPVEDIIMEALQGISQLVPCLSASVTLFDFETRQATLVTSSDYGGRAVHSGEKLPLKFLRLVSLVQQRGQYHINDLALEADPDALQRDLSRVGVRACLVTPLLMNDELLGALVLGVDQPGGLGDAHALIARQFSDQLAVAVSHMRLREQVHQHNLELQRRVELRTQELDRTRSRVEAILNNSSDAIILARADSMISQTNLAFDRLFQYQADELFHRSLGIIADPSSVEALEDAIRAVVEGGMVQRCEIVARRKDGTTFDAEVGLSLIRAAEDQRGGIVCHLHDITERKRYEAGLVASLSQQRELSELRSRFVSMASHEFRTPLTAIVSSAEILQNYLERMDEPQKDRHFSRIHAAARHMTQLLDDILFIGKVESEQLPVDFAWVDLQVLAHEVLEQVQIAAPDTISFEFNTSQESCPAWIDEKLMRHLIANLLSNAVKYSPQGGQVRLELHVQGDQAVIQVTDQGIGIPEEDLPRLFQPFFRGKNAEPIQGTGLGLAIAKRAVDQHRGTINVSSQPNEGTAFTVTFPRKPLEI